MSAFGGKADIASTSFDAVRGRDNGDRVIDVKACGQNGWSVPLPLNCDLTDDHDNSRSMDGRILSVRWI
jgi:hypothetical protein